MLWMLYDITLDSKGVRFILFHFFTVHLLRWANIKCVTEISYFSPGSIAAYNFKNRLFASSFLIEVQRGWFAKKILVTPKDPEQFVAELRRNGVHVVME